MSPETEQLAREVAERTGESTDEVIRKALEERKRALPPVELEPEATVEDWIRLLEERIWSKVKPEYLGRSMSKEEMDEIVGYGPEGV